MVRLSIYTPAEDTPTASTRGICSAADFRAATMPGWLNELAFVPVDANPEAMRDEWSGDIGCGVKYFSQDGVMTSPGPGAGRT